jgi:formaldehyde-activating enzyme involved in methanogenesis
MITKKQSDDLLVLFANYVEISKNVTKALYQYEYVVGDEPLGEAWQKIKDYLDALTQDSTQQP